MPFKPVLSITDLPTVGTSREAFNYDFKCTVAGTKPTTHAEMAKDVASFANASGGTILVGACRRQTGSDFVWQSRSSGKLVGVSVRVATAATLRASDQRLGFRGAGFATGSF